jgi:mycofactocin glycosyltransferase
VIPARNEAASIQRTLQAVHAQSDSAGVLELIVVDDGSTDETPAVARAAGAIVLSAVGAGNPAAARNHGAAAASGEIIVFLDADCIPADGWLKALLSAHAQGESIVGGALALPAGLPFSARCDYYASAYHVHPRQRAGYTPNHTPANLSVRRAAFSSTGGFTESGPMAYGHEELAWQAELQRAGQRIRFEPAALVFHYNRPGLSKLLHRNYRWGYSSIEGKALSGAARFAWLYRHPRLLIVGSAPLAIVQFLYIIACWLMAGILEPLLMLPVLLLARLAYAAGAMVGGIRWLRRARAQTPAEQPHWRG